MKLLRLTLASIVLMSLLAVGHSSAATPDTTGVRVSPAIEQLTFTKSQNDAAFPAVITNNTSGVVSITVSARDFTSLNQTGALSFSDSESDPEQGHQLASALHPTLSQLAVGPGQSVTDQINVTGIKQLAVGGHYGALIYEVSSQSQHKGNSIQVQEALSTLVFASTNGSGTQVLRVVPPVASSFYTVLPQSIEAVFANDGNTQSVIHGNIQIFNSSSQLVSQGVMNINSNLILPGSERLFTIPMHTISSPKGLFGRYTLRMTYYHDGQDGYNTYNTTFYYASTAAAVRVAILVLCFAVAVFLVLRFAVRGRSKRRVRSQKKTLGSAHVVKKEDSADAVSGQDGVDGVGSNRKPNAKRIEIK